MSNSQYSGFSGYVQIGGLVLELGATTNNHLTIRVGGQASAVVSGSAAYGLDIVLDRDPHFEFHKIELAVGASTPTGTPLISVGTSVDLLSGDREYNYGGAVLNDIAEFGINLHFSNPTGSAGLVPSLLSRKALAQPADERSVVIAFGLPDGQTRLEITEIMYRGTIQGDALRFTQKIFSADGKLVDIKQSLIWHQENGKEVIQDMNDFLIREDHCFPRGTKVRLADGRTQSIENLTCGELVSAFDGSFARGCGDLAGKAIIRTFSNITDTWIVLSNGLTVTPGHRFLDAFGQFRTVEDILATDGQVVLEDGSLAKVTGEYIRYTEETAHLYEQAEGDVTPVVGELAMGPVYKKGWKTYNFEVEDYHTYIAGGVRVHNASVYLASGTHTYPGTPIKTGGYEYVVNADGSTTQTGKIVDGDVVPIANGRTYGVGERRYDPDTNSWETVAPLHGTTQDIRDYAPSGNASEAYQYAGNGPSVPLASGASANAGTIFSPGNGYNYVVNSDGSVTNLDTGHTSGNGQRQYNPDTNRWETVGATQSSGGSSSALDGGLQPTGTIFGSSSDDDDDSDSGGKPILIDLDGDGVDIGELGASNFFFDMAGDGKLHRTAWAGAGDGVLVYDANNDGVIDKHNEVIFTEWDGSARSDLEALLARFDSNNNGKLDAGDDDWSLFKVVVTNADRTTTLEMLGDLDIVEIGLVSNNHERAYGDGSQVLGEAEFKRTDGSTGIVADTKLSYEAEGFVVTRTVTNNLDGSTTITNVAARVDGSIASRTVSTTSADGNSRSTRFDDDGDGVDDRVVNETRVVAGDSSVTETRADYDGSGNVLIRRQVTTTSADGDTVTIEIDSTGSGSLFDQEEIRVKGVDGSLTVTTRLLNADGSTRAETTTTTTEDGLNKTVQTELTGSGAVNASQIEATSVAGDGTRIETVISYAGSGTSSAHRVASVVSMTSANGDVKTIATDADGDGDLDLGTASTIVHNVDDSTTTTLEVRNGDHSLRSRSVTELSANGNSRATSSDLDGDGDIDLVAADVRTVDGGGTTTRTITSRDGNGDLIQQSVSTWSADGKTRSTSVDSDGDGQFDILQTSAVVSGNLVETSEIYSPNGATLVSRSVSTTSNDGLTKTVQIDADGSSVYDAVVSTATTLLLDGSSVVTEIAKNGAGTTTIARKVTTTSADGLTKTVESYQGTETDPESKVVAVRVLNGDDSVTDTVSTYSGAILALAGRVVSVTSADRLSSTTSSYVGTQSLPQKVAALVSNSDGSRTETVSIYSTDGSTLLGRTVTTSSADGLTVTARTDVDGDADYDGTTVASKLLNTDGTTTVITTSYAGTGTSTSDRVGQSVVTTSGNGLSKESEQDLDGDGDTDAQVVETTAINADGSTTTSSATFNGDGTIEIARTVTEVSGEGLTRVVRTHEGGETTPFMTVAETTVLESDGSTEVTTVRTSANNDEIGRSIVKTSSDGLVSTASVDLDGNGFFDSVVASTLAATGILSKIATTYTSAGALKSSSTLTTSADGLLTTTTADLDGNGSVDRGTSDVTTLNADGSQTRVITVYMAGGAIESKTTTLTSADGRSATTSWEGAGAGVTGSRTETYDVDSDGSTTRTTSNYKVGGVMNDSTTVNTSADGTVIRTTRDIDGDGIVDETVVQRRLADGSLRVSLMDGPVSSAGGREFGTDGGTYISTSGSGLSKTTHYDMSGDGLAESQTVDVTVFGTDGTTVRTITRSNLTGGNPASANPVYTATVKDTMVVTTTADGLDVTTVWDFTGSGTFTHEKTELTELGADGSVTKAVSNYVSGALVSRYLTNTSADGLEQTTQWDKDGTGGFDQELISLLVRNDDGSTTQTIATSIMGGALLSEVVTTTSADGRQITRQEDLDGDGTYEKSIITVLDTLADGSTIATISQFDASSILLSRETTEARADGTLAITSRDLDGDGTIDHVNVVIRSVDGTLTTTSTELDDAGVTTSYTVSVMTPDGRLQNSTQDVDGDGIIDRTTSHTWRTFADGSSEELVEVFNVSQTDSSGVVSVISPVLDEHIKIVVSADGRTTTVSTDVNGDGTFDEVSTTVQKMDGSTVTTITDSETARAEAPEPGEVKWASTVASGAPTVPASTIVTLSADGRSKLVQADYDGNGTYEHTETWTTLLDGFTSATIVEVNSGGSTVAQGTLSISADGRTVTLNKDSNNDGVVDHIEVLTIATSGGRVRTVSTYNSDGTLKQTATTTVSSNGISSENTVLGGAANDTLTGGTGDDILDGSTGADMMAGGLGNDTYVVDNAGDVATELANRGTDTIKASISLTLGSNIENLTLTGVSALDGTGNTLNNVIVGNSANNALVGGDGDDILEGGAGADSLSGGSGVDIASYQRAVGRVDVDLGNLANNTGEALGDTYAGIEIFFGSDFDDELTAAAATSATFVGGAGDDSLKGGDAVDYLYGEDGDDYLSGGGAGDYLSGGAGDDTYALWGNDTVVEAANGGIDTIRTSSAYTLVNHVEHLVLTGSSVINGTGNALDNHLTGNSASNLLTGGDGNDTFLTSGGIDGYAGGNGVDTADFSGFDYAIWVAIGDAGHDARTRMATDLSAGTWVDVADFSSIENVVGSDFDDYLQGDAGNNNLRGGLGNDTMAGGAGDDTYIVRDTGDVVIEAASAGTDVIVSSRSYTLGDNVENLTLTGSASYGTGNALANVITGNDNGVELDGAAGDDTLIGGADADTLIGGLGADSMTGGAGNDAYSVDNAGDVVMEAAGGGVDIVNSSVSFTLGDNVENLNLTGSGATNGTGNALDNVIDGSSAVNVLNGGAGNDTLSAEEGDDTLYGGDGHDYLNGGAGTDLMDGGKGNDTYVVNTATDIIVELAGQGTDLVLSNVSYTLSANVENLTLTGAASYGTGNALGNVITGNDGAVELDGAAGNDTLIGGAGNDHLIGGLGADRMTGGVGNDIYEVDNVSDIVVESSEGGTDHVNSSVSFTLSAHIESLNLTGSAAIDGTGNDLDNLIDGSSAANILTGGGGNDTLNGEEGNDTLLGGDGDDHLNGGAGADAMTGGAGDDTYVVNDVGDVVMELTGGGTDSVTSSRSITLSSEVEKLTLTGAALIGTGNDLANIITGHNGGVQLSGAGGDDTLVGGTGNDTLNGGTGNDLLTGGAGNDLYTIDSAGDVIVELAGGGIDSVDSSVSYVLGDYLENLNLTGTAQTNATGNALDNIIEGSNAINTLIGGDGNDSLHGEDGADTLYGDAGDDYLYGGTGADTLYGGDGNDILAGGTGADILQGGSGADTMSGGTGNDTFLVDNIGDTASELTGEGTDIVNASVSFTLGDHIENLTLSGGAVLGIGNGLANVLIGHSSGVELRGEGGDDTLTGGSGNDLLIGGSGADTLAGGTGNDIYDVDDAGDVVTEAASAGSDTVRSTISYVLSTDLEHLVLTGASAINGTGNAQDNTLTGNSAANTLTAGGGNDILNGGDGADTLNGGDGNDALDGGLGVDTLVGGIGDDIYYVDSAGEVVTELTGEGTDLVIAAASYTLGNHIENLTLVSGASLGTGNSLVNTLTGHDGGVELNGAGGNDALYGGIGADLLIGGTGADTMAGGAGDDIYEVDSVSDMVTEAASQGTDLIRSSVSYTLGSDVENLTLTGSAGLSATGNGLANVLTGNSGANTLNGGAGADTMVGGGGNDTYVVDNTGDIIVEDVGGGTDSIDSSVSYTLGINIENLNLTGTTVTTGTGNSLDNLLEGSNVANTLYGGAGNDTLYGEDGNDTLHGDDGNDTIYGGLGIDTIHGGDGNDTIDGGSSADIIYGGAGDDSITGGTGADAIHGGAGVDFLTGGDGNDTFLFTDLSESGILSGTRDQIIDFAAGDKLGLSAIDANDLLANDQAFVLDADASFSIGEIRQSVVGSDLLVEINTDGDSDAEFSVLLVNRGSLLSTSDFIV